MVERPKIKIKISKMSVVVQSWCVFRWCFLLFFLTQHHHQHNTNKERRRRRRPPIFICVRIEYKRLGKK